MEYMLGHVGGEPLRNYFDPREALREWGRIKQLATTSPHGPSLAMRVFDRGRLVQIFASTHEFSEWLKARVPAGIYKRWPDA